MSFALSTRWNAYRNESGEKLVEEILELGIDRIELSYDLHLGLVPGIRKMVEQKAVSVTSTHNFCPVPVGFTRGHPELYSLSDLNAARRETAVAATIKCITFAAEVGAKVLVAHVGNVSMTNISLKLMDLAEQGKLYDNKYEKLKLKVLMQRDKKVRPYLDQLSQSIEDLLPVLQEHNVRLGIENLPTWESLPTEAELERILQRFNSPFVRYWHDIGHGQVRQNLGFIGQLRWLEKLKPYLAGMHIHDVAFPAQDHIMPPNGNIIFSDFAPYAQATDLRVIEPAPGTNETELVEAARLLAAAWELPFKNASPGFAVKQGLQAENR